MKKKEISTPLPNVFSCYSVWAFRFFFVWAPRDAPLSTALGSQRGSGAMRVPLAARSERSKRSFGGLGGDRFRGFGFEFGLLIGLLFDFF